MWIDYIAPITVILPAFCFIMGPVLSRRGFHYFTAVICGIEFILISLLFPHVMNGHIPDLEILSGLNISLRFTVDVLNFFMGAVSAFLWTLSSMYGIEYQKEDDCIKRYNVFSLLSLSGMLGIVFSGNLFTLYIFFELLTITSSVLIFHKQTETSLTAGLLTIFCGIVGGLILLLVIIETYNFTGTGNLSLIGLGLKNHPSLSYIFMGYIIGFGVKAGLFPVHIWIPSAYSVAPSPASALLSGVMKKAGVYGIIKIIYNIIGKDILARSHLLLMNNVLILSLITILFASAIAITQFDIKKMLAYSSIAQVGYIIMGTVLLSPLSLTGALLHFFNHAIMKSSLFLCAGCFIRKTGFKGIPNLIGIGKKMPITTICFTIASLSIVGIPPFNGFTSKWFLSLGALEVEKLGIYNQGTGIICFAVLLISSFLNLIYYSPIIIGGWFGKEETDEKKEELSWNEAISEEMRGSNLWMMGPIIFLTICIIFFGMFPGFPLKIIGKIVEEYFKT